MKEPSDERAWDMQVIVDSYLSASPARLAKALEYTVTLDAMGAPAAFARLLAHNNLYGQAMRMDSLPFMDVQAQAAIKASRELVGDDRREWAWSSGDAFINKADLEGRRGQADAAIITLQ